MRTAAYTPCNPCKAPEGGDIIPQHFNLKHFPHNQAALGEQSAVTF